ncbi:MAG: 50S ribosomal protein L29 [bacterium]|nr:50S ribosomal protein L29 [bacterium]
MKKNDLAKLKNQSPAELAKTLADSREKLVKLTHDIAGNKVKNVHSANALRRDIARIMTLLHTKATPNN